MLNLISGKYYRCFAEKIMNEVIKSITEAEGRAAEIKAQALSKADEIFAEAQKSADEVSRKSETNCKLYKDNQIKKAEKDAEADYEKYVSEKKSAAKAYADSLIKNTGATVQDIVRRITSGSC
jgi:vacuolar-type H+-ATPase subunit H